MSDAEKMFRDLGYWKLYDDDDKITFMNDYDEAIVFSKSKKLWFTTIIIDVNIELTRAIVRQMKELGWL